jgi:isopentenyl phosphate kinase
MEAPVFLKLGGSLITDKTQKRTPRREVIRRLAHEIALTRSEYPELRLVIGHGSGSYGHVAAKKHATYQGVATPDEWVGFAEVWYEARLLNQIVIESLSEAGLPVIAFPPSAGVVNQNHQVLSWDISPLQAALNAGLIPVVAGDTVFDQALGGTIFSTEDAFIHLAQVLHPKRILLAGIEPGVWADYPACTQIVSVITPGTLAQVAANLQGASAIDVTGGMVQKVIGMLSLLKEVPELEVVIFSGSEPDRVRQCLKGAPPGTVIRL